MGERKETRVMGKVGRRGWIVKGEEKIKEALKSGWKMSCVKWKREGREGKQGEG